MLHLVRAAISDRELINKWVCGYSVLESYSPSNFTECSGRGVLPEKTDFVGISGMREELEIYSGVVLESLHQAMYADIYLCKG